jgi:hypothetical protein
MTGLSDSFKPRALSPEGKRGLFGIVRRSADELRISRDQLLPFEQELFEAVRGFFSIRDPSFSQATLERAPEQFVKLHKAANKYAEVVRMPSWLRSLVEGALPKQFAAPPFGFVFPPSPANDLLDMAERVLETGHAALIVAKQSDKAAKKKRGRQPKSQPTHRDFSVSDALVWSVLGIASRRGGTVTVDKKDGGTLDRFFAAASELDVWPRGCAPQGLTSSRLYRLHRQWRVFHKPDIK